MKKIFLLIFIVPLFSFAISIKQIATGASRTCVLWENGKVKCWGENATGALGLGDTLRRGDKPNSMGSELPFVDLGDNSKVVSIGSGGQHTCALLDSGKVKCWGLNSNGQLGIGKVLTWGWELSEMGGAVPDVPLGKGRVIALTVGKNHNCALFEEGRIKCWGGNNEGQLGLGDAIDRGTRLEKMGEALPFVNLGTHARAVSVTAGNDHSCALFDSGKVKCWGGNQNGQLGLGDTVNRGVRLDEMGDALPFVDLGKGVKVTKITSGPGQTRVLLANGTVKNWGFNRSGILGLGDRVNRGDQPNTMGDFLMPVDLGPNVKVVDIGGGNSFVCALLSTAEMKCWGANVFGELGLGDGEVRGAEAKEMGLNLPIVNHGLPIKNIISEGSSAFHQCALLNNDGLRCWGQNTYGSLGLGDTRSRGASPDDMGSNLEYVELGVTDKAR